LHYLGAAFKAALFGLKVRWLPDKDPWVYENPPLIEKPEDLDRLRPPDFYEGGIMPAVHEFFQRLNELAAPGLTIRFPEWIRGPFGVARYLRGAENLFLDIMDRPEFVHRLMRFITDAQKNWIAERAKFLGIKIEKGFLYNDDVNCPSLSPSMYEELVLPYEIELCQFQGGIKYWHSCGNLTPLLPHIRKIPLIDMLHVSP
jgi:uroporphyrinogen-III decarboxylase